MKTIKLESSWTTVLYDEFSKEYMQTLRTFLKQAKKEGKIVYPKGSEYFNALNLTPFEQVKVVILGQDPYHGPGQAHGLSFSVRPNVSIPPSLMNIYHELDTDLNIRSVNHGCLEHWARQGVLLLNSVLTVEHKKPASHQGLGWEQFTDSIIDALNKRRQSIVFILWGSYAQKKGRFIDPGRHLIIKSAHPSPLSAYRGFFGSKPFSQTNEYLIKHHIQPINWHLPRLA